jgi:hypothetical protein
MRITDQYIWHIVFVLLFFILVLLGSVILEGNAYKTYGQLTVIDYTLIALATFRITRLFVYDKITEFFREQFWDMKVMKTKVVLIKPESGPRRTLADLLSCPWCTGLWVSAGVTFFYLFSPYALFATILFAVAGVATLVQLLANLVGWKAEQFKRDVDRL